MNESAQRLPEIVLTGPIFGPGTELLREVGSVRQLHQPTDAEIDAAVRGADAAVVRIHRLTGDTIRAAEHLKVIGRFGVGIDNIDLEVATDRGIPVVYTPGANAQAVAEHALALTLAMLKRLVFWHHGLLAGNWEARWTEHSDDVVGKTMCVVGLGNVGRHLAHLAAGVKMRVVGHAPLLTARAAKQFGVELMGLNEALAAADIVSLHAPLTPETRGLIDARRLQLLKPGAYLVNTARGGLLDLDAVYNALYRGHLAGVALDVYPTEPPDLTHPLFRHPNFIGTPHCAHHTQTTMDNMGLIVAREVATVLRGERPLFVANPEVFEPAG
ncbi:MAG: hypothetical protein AUJ96_06795 [Armatimonadetes bacterium CG2_30_66_41]|nr:hydroxyacid dehydrogenase [Armatimonadota bacterium]OIP07833.1 MAG: hypothetical protein AUJ96_06795 [Armatimonadetes bacterium CG2_30_66_41]NCO90109.1 hydroxyacid dehydrogenase [Armatimonadota bacterium]NCP33596.1 hydroxyacid dehydrogenase [Armatimonadota bacterium]NCQ28908.1 hydroxyacid dehydrogenase [Armatimonadota bacterium]